jgi:hypothetical protein
MELSARNRLNRVARESAKRMWHRAFLLLERARIHVTPVHFYTGLPNVVEMAKNRDTWARRSSLPGIAVEVDEQVEFLERTCLPFQSEYTGLAHYTAAARKNGDFGYGEIESEALHGIIRAIQPSLVIQVGCGLATHCMLSASALNERPTEIVCIEPYPNEGLKNAPVELVGSPVQAVPPELFSRLGRDDILFVDSTHVVQVGSDVNYLVLEILPRLAPGVIIHFHDIYLPYDYPRRFLEQVVFPLETSLVRAFMIDNPAVRMLACMSLLHYDRPDALRRIFPDYDPQANENGLATDGGGRHFPSSLWLQMTG